MGLHLIGGKIIYPSPLSHLGHNYNYIILTAPGSHPLNSTGSALNSTHISLDWSSPALEDVNGIIREYRINVTEDETSIVTQLTTDPTMTEIVIGPLHPFYVYHCTILAYTIEGGPSTAVISVRTAEDGMFFIVYYIIPRRISP